jgi:hypothetical protein
MIRYLNVQKDGSICILMLGAVTWMAEEKQKQYPTNGYDIFEKQ